MARRIAGGIDLHVPGAPRQVIEDGPPMAEIAILGADYPGLRFNLLVQPGDEVAAGQAVLADRRKPDRVVVSPVSGRVATISRGARRGIETIVVEMSGTAAQAFSPPSPGDGGGLKTLINASGLWAALRARPFGRPAELADVPQAMFITAMDTRPHAPDPALVIGAHAPWFRRGAEALATLTSGKTYLCHAAGAGMPEVSGVVAAAFSGKHPAGLASTHIHALHPVGRGSRPVWQMGYQDVIALGHLLETGEIWTDRIVALSGPAVSAPVLIRTRPGADLHRLVQRRLAQEAVTIRSGSILDGRVATYLGRDHLQVSVVPHIQHNAPLQGWRRLLRKMRETELTPAIIPNAVHERAAPVGIMPIPLLRALSVGDVDMAQRLGALELVEEDLALLSHVDGNGTDFGKLLRAVLDELEGAS